MSVVEQPIPGILWVNSDVIEPERLSREDFNSWYCDEHIPDVVAKSGVHSAFRYEHVVDGSTPARPLRFLTIYRLDDLNFMQTTEFKSLEGQSSGPNRDRIFKNAKFDTRAYQLIQQDEVENSVGSDPPELLLFASISHNSDTDLDEWYQKEHVRLVSQCTGHRRTSRFKIFSRSILSAFERTHPPAPKWLAIHEFDGPVLPWEELTATDQTERAKQVIPGMTDLDFGCFRLTRAYENL